MRVYETRSGDSVTVPVQFVLDGQVVLVDTTSPTRTVLQYLREDLHRSGTKEGCAEGDCGACTVVVAQLTEAGDALQYEAINACIRFLPTLQGKAIFTVENLAGTTLHPVQQALVDQHGSQCGFCTPGIVMSLFAQFQQATPLDRRQTDDVLSGNLCRCTGYRPIIDAAINVAVMAQDKPAPPNPHMDDLVARTIRALQTLKTEKPRASAAFSAPVEVPDLLSQVAAQPDATLIAGGTDVGLWVTKALRELPALIYLGNVRALQEITSTEDALVIGSTVNLTRAMQAITGEYPELQDLFTRFASVPIRNAATLGGNIANGSPIGDSMPALMALGATLTLGSHAQTRQLAIEDFFIAYGETALGADEVLLSVRIPRRQQGLHLAGYKVSKRFDQDISAVCMGISLHLDEAQHIASVRIAYGGMAATPKRARATEAALTGAPWQESSIADAINVLTTEFAPISDMRASAAYRSQVAGNLLRRFFLATQHSRATAADAGQLAMDVYNHER